MVVGPRRGSSKWQGHKHNAGSEQVSDGFSALQSVQPQNRVEQALHDLLSLLYANATDLRTMNDGQVEQLRDIALRCPLDDGLAVHVARAALLSIDTLPKGYMNPCELLSPEDGEKAKMEMASESLNRFAVYPNPNNGQMVLDYHLEMDNAVIELHDLVGNRLFTRNMVSGTNVLPIELNGLSGGLYILRVITDERLLHSEKLSIIPSR